MVALKVQDIIGFMGIVGFLLQLIGPQAVTPTIGLYNSRLTLFKIERRVKKKKSVKTMLRQSDASEPIALTSQMVKYTDLY